MPLFRSSSLAPDRGPQPDHPAPSGSCLLLAPLRCAQPAIPGPQRPVLVRCRLVPDCCVHRAAAGRAPASPGQAGAACNPLLQKSLRLGASRSPLPCVLILERFRPLFARARPRSPAPAQALRLRALPGGRERSHAPDRSIFAVDPAEGEIDSVDTRSTAKYVYDALHHRVRSQIGSSIQEYLYDMAGHRISTWVEPADTGNEGRIYWDGQQIAYRSSDGSTYFDHQDYLGTERMRTDSTGAVAATFVSLPWGDGYSANIVKSAADQDTSHFAGLDQDVNSANAPMSEHAQFRNYSFQQGRWLSPDPYDGSYDLTNPQSFNRYAYVLNNPLSFTDPSGLECANPDARGHLHANDDGDDGCISDPSAGGGTTVYGDPPSDPNPCDLLNCFPSGGSSGNQGNQGSQGNSGDGSTAPSNTNQQYQPHPSHCQGLSLVALAYGAGVAKDAAKDIVAETANYFKAAAPLVGAGAFRIISSVGEPTLGLLAGAAVESGVAEGAGIVLGGYLGYQGITAAIGFYKEQNVNCQ